MEHVSRYIGYDYGELDEVALIGALEPTDDEAPEGWFDYSPAGTPPLTVSLAQAVDGSIVSVRMRGEIDPLLTARLETLLNLL